MMIKSISAKRGQVTIFIILAIIVVATIVGYFLLRGAPISEINPQENPQAFIEKCLKDNIEKSSEKIFSLGGALNAENYLLFNKTNIRFLCHTAENNVLCKIEDPIMKKTMEDSIREDSLSEVRSCFDDLKKSFENYDYTEEPLSYTVEILPQTIRATALKKITISKDDQFQQFNSFISEEYSPAYNFILITNGILRDELDCECGVISCTSDITLWSQTNLGFRLGLDITPRMERVYSIQDRMTNQEFKFAVRNCFIA